MGRPSVILLLVLFAVTIREGSGLHSGLHLVLCQLKDSAKSLKGCVGWGLNKLTSPFSIRGLNPSLSQVWGNCDDYTCSYENGGPWSPWNPTYIDVNAGDKCNYYTQKDGRKRYPPPRGEH